uniref:Uncharacterized protein n=1 Tax=Arundo donax TaxID=35708 RepID=A0A0A9DMS5_ARUDO
MRDSILSAYASSFDGQEPYQWHILPFPSHHLRHTPSAMNQSPGIGQMGSMISCHSTPKPRGRRRRRRSSALIQVPPASPGAAIGSKVGPVSSSLRRSCATTAGGGGSSCCSAQLTAMVGMLNYCSVHQFASLRRGDASLR